MKYDEEKDKQSLQSVICVENDLSSRLCFKYLSIGEFESMQFALQLSILNKLYDFFSGMFLSVPFIIATFIVYISLPELRNLHGKCLLSYLGSLGVGYLVLGLNQQNHDRSVDELSCTASAYTIYFSLLSAFLWLNVISFDLWSNFRYISYYFDIFDNENSITRRHNNNILYSKLSGIQGQSKLSDRKRFIIYCIYAWGLAFSLTTFGYFIDSVTERNSIYRPGFGLNTCFLQSNRTSQTIFFYGPLALIITFNCIFFILTAIRIRNVQKELQAITSRDDYSYKKKKLDNHRSK